VLERVARDSAAVVHAERRWVDAIEELAQLESQVAALENALSGRGKAAAAAALVSGSVELGEALAALLRTETMLGGESRESARTVLNSHAAVNSSSVGGDES